MPVVKQDKHEGTPEPWSAIFTPAPVSVRIRRTTSPPLPMSMPAWCSGTSSQKQTSKQGPLWMACKGGLHVWCCGCGLVTSR